MSKSFRKNSIFPNNSAETEKWNKKSWHSLMRSKEKQRLHRITKEEMEAFIPLEENDVSNPWLFDKDGKHYLNSRDTDDLVKYMRK